MFIDKNTLNPLQQHIYPDIADAAPNMLRNNFTSLLWQLQLVFQVKLLDTVCHAVIDDETPK